MKDGSNWIEHFLAGFSSDKVLIELMLGDLSEECHQRSAHQGRFAINVWYIYQVIRTALHLAGQWFYSATKASLFTRIVMVLLVSSLCVLVTVVTYNYDLSIANFAMSLLSHGGGQEPLTINLNEIARNTLYAGMLSSFIGGIILSALSRSAPMIGVLLLSILLVISSILIPFFSGVWPLWSFLILALVALILSQLGGIAGLTAKAIVGNRDLGTSI